MKKFVLLILALNCSVALSQESVIRVLGAYPSHLNLSASEMTAQLQRIMLAWNDSGLPADSVITIQQYATKLALRMLHRDHSVTCHILKHKT